MSDPHPKTVLMKTRFVWPCLVPAGSNGRILMAQEGFGFRDPVAASNMHI